MGKKKNKSYAVELAGKISKLDDTLMVAYGWASVTSVGGELVIDSQGDIIDDSELLKAVHEFVTDSRQGKLMHKGKRAADIVDSVVFTADLQKALGIDLGKTGWFIGMK